MKQLISSAIIVLLALASVQATKISNVKVDCIKGTVTGTEGDQMTRFYMGRLTYTFLAEAQDSISVDFTVKDQVSGNPITVLKKSVTWALVKQRYAADTNKIVYFRAKIAGTPQPPMSPPVTADANMSECGPAADSLVRK